LKQGNTATVADSFVNGSVQFEENRGTSTTSNSSIGASLQAYKNSGRVDFRGNSFVGDNIQTYEIPVEQISATIALMATCKSIQVPAELR